jgi:pimeloyl-ACP methyl ester carboxylesterase
MGKNNLNDPSTPHLLVEGPSKPMPMHAPAARGAHRLARRTVIRAAAIGLSGAAVHLAAPGNILAAGRRQTPVSAAATPPSGADPLAGTPLGDHLALLVEAVNTGGESLTETQVEARMAPSFLQTVPAAEVIGLLQSLAAGFGQVTYTGVTRPPTETQAVALIATAAGISLALPISVEAEAPFLITGLNVYPAPTPTGQPLLPIAPATPTFADVEGRAVYYTDSGTGGPTVVLESGLGDSAATWAGLLPDIATIARVVSYDRPGTSAGASDPAPTPRTAQDIVADLHALLENAGIPGPYVLVGHSLGGIVARLYAGQYPGDVSGMVLIDATHEDQIEGLADILPPELLALVADSTNPEGVDVEASLMQMADARTATPVPPMPLVVLSAEPGDPSAWPPGWPVEEANQLHHELQADLANLVPEGRLVVTDQSGHYIHQSQPDLVLQAIQQVVAAVQDPTTWGTPSATPAP